MDKQEWVNGNAAKTRGEAGAIPPCRKMATPAPPGFGGGASRFLEIGSGPDSCRSDLPSFLILRSGQCLFRS